MTEAAISRSEAIEMIARDDLRHHDRTWRDEELFCISASDMDQSSGWLDLPQHLREEVKAIRDGEIADPEHPRFDAVLLISIRGRYFGATNAFLASKLAKIGKAAAVEGEAETLVACPCCGRRSLGARGFYEICAICWWEDDGQDNVDASKVIGGPNGALSLTAARANYLRHGTFNPARSDLVRHQVPAEKYAPGRVFALADDGKLVCEVGTDWREPL
jgi:hypothetical protein